MFRLLLKALLAPLQKKWGKWLMQRSPPSQRITFTQRNVYIVPSKGGFFYVLVVLILLLGAINEQLNLAYALAFLLGGVGLSSMSLTHANLRGLSVEIGKIHSVHAGQTLDIPIVLDATLLKKGRYGLLINGQLNGEVEAGERAIFHLAVTTDHRGLLQLPRWRIETTYPLGFFRAWGYWQTSCAILIWPRLEPLAPDYTVVNVGEEKSAATTTIAQQKTQENIREWQRGDAMRSIIWKKSATRMIAGSLPVVRDSNTGASPSSWIDWEMTNGLAYEARLSRLATWLNRCEQAQQNYGLRLPGKIIACNQGLAHLTTCLDTLAMWDGQTGANQ